MGKPYTAAERELMGMLPDAPDEYSLSYGEMILLFVREELFLRQSKELSRAADFNRALQ
jgi:hypothetical protein